MLRTVFVAQKTLDILKAKLWNFSANYHKNSSSLDILITIDVDIFRSLFFSDSWIGQKGLECRKIQRFISAGSYFTLCFL
jgi:hypothetical protein